MTTEWARRATLSLPEDSPPVIVSSWERCAARDLSMDAFPAFRSVDRAELRQRLRANDVLVHVASRHLRWLSNWLSRIPHVVYLVDRDGIVLFSVGDRAIMDAAGLHPGIDWSEARMGTNGAGTALVSDRPVAVLGCEHYVRAWHGASCLAAPVHDAAGVVGAMDLSTAAEDCDPELLGLVAHAALTIDQELLARQLDTERKAREAAERRQIDREQLLAAVAHDLRGPNSVVSITADLLPTSEIESAQARIKRASSRIEGLVRDLLDFSRLTDGRFGVVREPGDLGRVVGEVVELFEPLAASRSIHLAYVGSADSISGAVRFDAGQMNRAISNLIQNALKFTPPGGSVLVGLERGTNEVLVAVTDSGPGFDGEDLTRMFEPYWSGRLRSDSTGLGLAIASGIVKAHRGRISAENLPEGGARFVIALPSEEP